MEIHSLRGYYIRELRKSHDAENQLCRALPMMMEAASSAELRKALEVDLEHTKDHATWLEMILDVLGEKTGGNHSRGMEGLIAEMEELREENLSPEVLDSALVAYALRIGQYEVSMYGMLRDYANILGDLDTASQLQITLEEEQEKLQRLARPGQVINVEAVGKEVAMGRAGSTPDGPEDEIDSAA